jgi:protein-L-isoaspartate(D-aspartate) O-methyltransferase
MHRPQIPIAIAALMVAPLAIAVVARPAVTESTAGYEGARERLIVSIRGYARTIGERDDPRVLQSMRSVQRHLFVPAAVRDEAYEDYPLPIGEDQTISQPSLVALMTHLLRPQAGDSILEVGTGSGYQAAILSRLVAKVYSIEIIEALAKEADARLQRLGYRNVQVRHGDGYLGWPEHAPFDAIIVTAGANNVPRPLLEQLKPGGRMVIPVGSTATKQQLRLISKDRHGILTERTITDVRFVPLTRKLQH